MADVKSKGAGKRRKKSSDVIDVGDKPDGETDADSKEASDEEAEEGTDEGLDTDLAHAAPIEVDDHSGSEPEAEGHDEEPAPKRATGASLARRDPMALYMSETRRYPLLTPEEEKALAVRLVEHGDSTAARKLIEANLRLVVKIAYEYRRAHRNLLDLVQEGNIGLIQAVGKFDPYRGVKLSSYAPSGSARTSSSSSSTTGAS